MYVLDTKSTTSQLTSLAVIQDTLYVVWIFQVMEDHPSHISLKCQLSCLMILTMVQPFPRRRSPITESTREVLFFIQLVFLRLATSEPLPQRPMRKSRRLRGQETQQATLEKVFGSAAMPLSGGGSPLAGTTPIPTQIKRGQQRWGHIFINTPDIVSL